MHRNPLHTGCQRSVGSLRDICGPRSPFQCASAMVHAGVSRPQDVLPGPSQGCHLATRSPFHYLVVLKPTHCCPDESRGDHYANVPRQALGSSCWSTSQCYGGLGVQKWGIPRRAASSKEGCRAFFSKRVAVHICHFRWSTPPPQNWLNLTDMFPKDEDKGFALRTGHAWQRLLNKQCDGATKSPRPRPRVGREEAKKPAQSSPRSTESNLDWENKIRTGRCRAGTSLLSVGLAKLKTLGRSATILNHVNRSIITVRTSQGNNPVRPQVWKTESSMTNFEDLDTWTILILIYTLLNTTA